jgi:hypothetical protein
MKVSSIVASVEYLKPRGAETYAPAEGGNMAGAAASLRKAYAGARPDSKVLPEENPRKALNELDKASANMQPLPTPTMIGANGKS